MQRTEEEQRAQNIVAGAEDDFGQNSRDNVFVIRGTEIKYLKIILFILKK